MAQDKDERATATGSPRKAPEAEDRKASSDRACPRRQTATATSVRAARPRGANST